LESNTCKFEEEIMPDNTTVYYAQVGFDRKPADAYNVFRKVDHPDSQSVHELYDRTGKTWIERRDLARYTRKGAAGADIITETQAEAIIGGWAS
jgi:hypothetical protein